MMPRAGDLILAREAPVGNVAIIPPRLKACLGQRTVLIRAAASKVLPSYLVYLLLGDEVQGHIASVSNGATVHHLNVQDIRNLPLPPLPPLDEQRRIASILSAYDDLIENNTRRIAILEEMARRIYEEWFVHFRFPGHERVRMVDSELGSLPAGWRWVKLKEVAHVNRKSIKRDREPEQIVYVDISSVATGSINKKEAMAYEAAPGRARRIVADGDVIWACVRPNRKSFSLVLDPEPNLIVSTGFAVLSAVAVPWTFLHQAVTTDDFVAYLTNHAKGAAYPAVGAEDFENAELILPDGATLGALNDAAEPMARLISALHRNNINLRTTRDLLLPKLISGELDVSALPEPEAVAA